MTTHEMIVLCIFSVCLRAILTESAEFPVPSKLSVDVEKTVGACIGSTITYRGSTITCQSDDSALVDEKRDTSWISSPSANIISLYLQDTHSSKVLLHRMEIVFENKVQSGEITLESMPDDRNKWTKIYMWSENCPNNNLLPYCSRLDAGGSSSTINTNFFPDNMANRRYIQADMQRQTFHWISDTLTYHLTSNKYRLNISEVSTDGNNNYYAITELSLHGWDNPENICNCHPLGVQNKTQPCKNGNQNCDCRQESPQVSMTQSTQCEPTVGQILPSRSLHGPKAGGTRITVTGRFLNHLQSNDSMTLQSQSSDPVNDLPMVMISRNDTVIIAESKEAEDTAINKEYRVDLSFHSFEAQYMYITDLVERCNFTYRENPEINDIKPLKSFLKGGIIQTVHGKNLDVYNPIMTLHIANTSVQETMKCASFTDVELHCPTPKMSARLPSYIHELITTSGNSHSLNRNQSFFITIKLDGYTLYEKRSELIKNGEIMIYNDPHLDRFPSNYKDYHQWKIGSEASTTITIEGERLKFGCEESDYSVSVGNKECTGIYIPDNQTLECAPPDHESGEQEVVVGVGNIVYNIGTLRYITSFWQYGLLRNIIIGLSVSVAAVIILIIIICYIKRRRSPTRHIDRRITSDRNGRITDEFGDDLEMPEMPRYSQAPAANLLEAMPSHLRRKLVKSQRLVDYSRIKVNKVIGKGQYGKVFVGEFNADVRWQVAIKTIKDENVTFEKTVKFIEEATMMLDFEHKHILPLLGVSINQNRPYVILPFMENGDLKTFISNPQNTFQLKDLLEFTLQVALGMQYLSKLCFVHRDLAARNCMVNKDMLIKISDFGLARDLYEKEYYKHEGNDPLPIKWMAIEVLQGHGTTLQSDVWSFGVLMWEVVTRGLKPYADVDNQDLMEHIGVYKRRLEQPASTPEPLYRLMLSCWNVLPEYRPNFNDIVQQLSGILSLVDNPEYLNLQRHEGKPYFDNSYLVPR